MEVLQQLLEKTLNEVPQLLLEKRLTEKLRASSIKAGKREIQRLAQHILSGQRENFVLDTDHDDVTIEITDEDVEAIVRATERFYNEQLPHVLHSAAGKAADLLYKSLTKRWSDDFKAQQSDIEAFKQRLEHRWGKALNKLRMLLAIVREWSQGAYERRQRSKGDKATRLENVMLRLHVRACQVTNEIIVLLENGLADGAMARWRTLHEIAIVAAVIAKFGEGIAERYMYYQIVESFAAIKAYERDYKDLGYRPPSKRLCQKIRGDYDRIIKRFGKKFGEEYGWAADHLGVTGKERLTFARLEKEAGDAFMRSPYKMASYNVHASPKGIYFRLGSMKGSSVLLAGASNAGLTDPAQHAAISLAEMTILTIGESLVFDDLIVANVITRLKSEIPREFWKADKKLRRDDRLYRKSISTAASQ